MAVAFGSAVTGILVKPPLLPGFLAQAAAQTAGNIIMPLCGAFSAFGVSASLSPELKLIKLADMI